MPFILAIMVMTAVLKGLELHARHVNQRKCLAGLVQ